MTQPSPHQKQGQHRKTRKPSKSTTIFRMAWTRRDCPPTASIPGTEVDSGCWEEGWAAGLQDRNRHETDMIEGKFENFDKFRNQASGCSWRISTHSYQAFPIVHILDFSAGPNNPNPRNINTTRWVVIHPGALAKRYPVPGRTFLHGPFGDRDNWVSQTTSAITHWIIMWTIGRKPHFLATNRGISCEPSNPFNSRNPMITQRSPKCSQCHIGHGGAARSFSTQMLVCSDFFGAMRQSFWVPGRLKHRRTVPWYVVISHTSQVKWPSNHHEFTNRPLTWSSCFKKIPQIGCDISRCASWVTPVVVLPESILLWWCESSLCWSVKQVELSRNVWIYDDLWSLMSLKLDLYIWDSTKDGQSENL